MRRLLMLMAVAALAVGAPVPVIAAAPGNDLPSNATDLGSSFPQEFTQDTTEATVTDDDFGCGAGGLDQASVWFTFTPGADGDVLIDPTSSSYGVGVNVFVGSAAPENLIACFGGPGFLYLEAGTTYYLMFADIDEDGSNGGLLDVVLDVPPPAIELTLTIDPTGKIDRSGQITVTGTISCSQPADFAEVDLEVSQTVGRFRIHGFSFSEASCDVDPTAWVATVVGENGTFAGGRASVTASAFACDSLSCGDAFATASVRLRR